MYMLPPMPKQAYTATEAARELGISVDTLRRWDREGRIRTKRDSANRRLVTLKEIADRFTSILVVVLVSGK